MQNHIDYTTSLNRIRLGADDGGRSMAPTISPRHASGGHLRTVVSRSVSSSLNHLSSRDAPISRTSIASLFAILLRQTIQISKRTLHSAALSSLRSREPVQPVFLQPSTLDKRQVTVLAIPTTYAGLNSGPAPGAVVGIVLGSIAGFILILYIILSAFRLSGYWGRETIVEEEIIRRSHRRSPRRSRSRSIVVAEVSRPPRERVREEIIVEEHVERRRPESVVVEEEEDEIVEVFEEASPERRPPRKPSTRSGFRTVDPAEFGGGGRPVRKVPRR